MLVLVAHTASYRDGRPVPFEACRDALERHWDGATRMVDVSSTQPPERSEGYWEALSTAWDDCRGRREQLTIVEHDIAVHEDVFPGFSRCREQWCGYPYALTTTIAPALGCTRFRAGLIQANADLFEELQHAYVMEGWSPRSWVRLDDRIAHVLRARGYELHRHEPPVTHLNPAQQLRTE